jgi:hypothetical protein
VPPCGKTSGNSFRLPLIISCKSRWKNVLLRIGELVARNM